MTKQRYEVTVDVTAEPELSMGRRTNEFAARSAQIGVRVELEDRGLETGAYAIVAALEEAARQARLTVGPDDTGQAAVRGGAMTSHAGWHGRTGR